MMGSRSRFTVFVWCGARGAAPLYQFLVLILRKMYARVKKLPPTSVLCPHHALRSGRNLCDADDDLDDDRCCRMSASSLSIRRHQCNDPFRVRPSGRGASMALTSTYGWSMLSRMRFSRDGRSIPSLHSCLSSVTFEWLLLRC